MPRSAKQAVATKTSAPVTGPVAPPHLFVGTSGWAYPTWKPDFYPAKLANKKLLLHYAARLNSCEVNYSFRKLPTPAQIDDWLAQTGPGFRLSFKAPQRITHFSRLRNCEQHVKDFLLAINPVVKAGKLGLLLFQLPPNFKADLPLLRDFLGMPCLHGNDAPPLAFEFRHTSWFTEEAETVLRRFNAALCIAETDEFKSPERHSAVGHTSFRLRQPGGYTPAQIDAFAERLHALSAERDVYVYFKHEDAPTGAWNAVAFLERANQLAAQNAWVDPRIAKVPR